MFSKTTSQHSIYQKGYKTIFANPVPIASGAALGTDVVRDALSTLWLALKDLIKQDKDINLAFGFCNVRFTARNMRAVFLKELNQEVSAPDFRGKDGPSEIARQHDLDRDLPGEVGPLDPRLPPEEAQPGRPESHA